MFKSFVNAIDFSNHNARLFVVAVDFVNGVNETGVSEGEVLAHCVVPVLFNSRAHDLLETRVDDVKLFGTLQSSDVLRAHKFEQPLLGFLFVLLCHSSWGHVLQVLQPLEVRAGDTTAVHKHVWGGDDASLKEDLLGLVGSWTISTFEDRLNLDFFGVLQVQ